MREIKFRAWDEERKRWFFWELTEPFSFSGWDTFTKPAIGCLDEKTIGQFTSLKDKNGKEIYEGDILCFPKRKRPMGIVEFEKFRGFCCRWDESTAQIRREDLSDGMPGNLESSGSPWEVIGNIYENPELLREEGK